MPETRLTLAVGKALTATPTKCASVPGEREDRSFGVFRRTTTTRVLVPRYFYISKLRDKTDKITVREEKQLPFEPTWKGELFPEQKEGAEQLVAALEKHHGAIGKGRCGSGKTVLGTYVMSRIRARRTIILVDRGNLAEQWAATVKERLPDAKICFYMPKEEAAKMRKTCGLPDVKMNDATVMIALVQSLIARAQDKVLAATLLIVDETHKFSAPCFSKALFGLSFRYSLGLTATDERRDGLSWVFRQMLGPVTVQLSGRRVSPVAYSVAIPTQERYIRKRFQMLYCRALRQSVIREDCLVCSDNPGRTMCGHSGGLSQNVNYTRLMLALANDKTRNLGIIKLIDTLHTAGHHILVFSKFKEHLTSMRNAFDPSGSVSSLYFGGMRKDALRAKVTFATYSMGEHGLDAPWKSAVVLAMPLSDPEQSVGRVERVYENKPKPVIIDPYVAGDFLGSQWIRRTKYYARAGYEQWSGTLPEACLRLANADAQCAEDASDDAVSS